MNTSYTYRVGEKFRAVPWGFLKIMVDIRDELEQNPELASADVLATSTCADRIEEVEREAAHPRDSEAT